MYSENHDNNRPWITIPTARDLLAMTGIFRRRLPANPKRTIRPAKACYSENTHRNHRTRNRGEQVENQPQSFTADAQKMPSTPMIHPVVILSDPAYAGEPKELHIQRPHIATGSVSGRSFDAPLNTGFAQDDNSENRRLFALHTPVECMLRGGLTCDGPRPSRRDAPIPSYKLNPHITRDHAADA